MIAKCQNEKFEIANFCFSGTFFVAVFRNTIGKYHNCSLISSIIDSGKKKLSILTVYPLTSIIFDHYQLGCDHIFELIDMVRYIVKSKEFIFLSDFVHWPYCVIVRKQGTDKCEK